MYAGTLKQPVGGFCLAKGPSRDWYLTGFSSEGWATL
jgi:hypothetical protein